MQNKTAMHDLSATAELELAQNYRSLIDDLNVGIAIYGSNGRLLCANQSFYDLHCISTSDVTIGMTMFEVIEQTVRSKKFGNFDAPNVYKMITDTFENGEAFRIELLDKNERKLRISRHLKPNNMVVETVEHLSSDTNSNNFSQDPNLKHAPSLTMEELTAALNRTPDGFGLYSPDGQLLAYNKNYVTLNPDIAHAIRIGARHADIIAAVYDSGQIELNGQTREEYFAYAEKERLEPSGATAHRNADGKWLRFSAHRLDNGCTIFNVADITQLKHHELLTRDLSQQAAAQEVQLHYALANMSQGLAMYNERQEVLVWNDRYIKMTGVDPALMKKGTLRIDILRNSIERDHYSTEKAAETLKRYKEDGFSNKESVHLHHLMDGRIIEVHNRPVSNKYTIVTMSDVTQREHDTARLAKYTRTLERSNAELQDFAYVASHDLQEPLRKIEAFGDRLTKKYGDTLPEDGAMYLNRMQNASSRMRQLINDLLTYSRLTNKTRPFNPVDLNDVVKGALSDLYVRLEETGGKVETKGLGIIDGDAVQLRQLFQNLISNALKFHKPNEAPIILVNGETITTEDSFGQPIAIHRIKISDNGIGFDRRFKDQIFAIFKRLHGRMEYEGTGIGLSTCRKIVDQHFGTIEADGEEGVGSTFSVDIPVKYAGEDSQ